MTSQTLHVFISGPFSSTNGRTEMENTIEAAKVQSVLIDYGYAVFCPHTAFYWTDEMHPKPYEAWMSQCLAWLSKCDVLLRLPGRSPGSAREVALAKQLGIPVVNGLDGLAKFAEAK